MEPSDKTPQVVWTRSIGTRITLTVVILIILMILIVGSGLIYIASQEQTRNVYQYQTKTSEEISLIISHYFKDISEHLEIFMSSSGFHELTPPEQKEALLDLLNEKDKKFQEFTLLSPEGTESVKVSRYYTYLPDEFQNKSESELFQTALRNQIVVSPIFYSPQSGQVSVHIAIPVKDSAGNVSQVLIATASVVQLWLDIQRIDVGKTGYVYIVDKNGNFIAYQTVSEILNKYGISLTEFPPVRQFVSNAHESSDEIPVYAGLHNEEVIGSFAPIPGTDWAVIAEVPTQEAFAERTQMIQVTLIALLLGCICAAILGYLLSQHLVHPILILTDTVARIGRGDLETIVTGTERQDEVGILATGISRMQHDLNQVYQNLETKISELNKTRNELQVSEEQYRTIFEHSQNPLILVEQDQSVTLINKKFEELWGFSRSEVIGKKQWTDFVAREEDLEMMRTYNKKRLAGEKDVPSLYHFQFITRSGDIRDIMISVTRMPGTGQTLGTLMDITEQKRIEREIIQKNDDLNRAYERLATNEKELRESYHKLAEYEKDLRESELKYRSVVEDQTELISRITPEGRFIFVNSAVCKFFNVPRDTILENESVPEPLSEYKDSLLTQISALTPKKAVHTDELKVSGLSGDEHWFHHTIRGFFSDNGSFSDFQSVAREITDRKNAEVALEKARNKLNLLNAITFEDIRNYLFTLSGYLEVHKDMISDETALSVFEREQAIVRKISQSLAFAKDYQDMGIRPASWQNVLQVYLFAISHLDLTHINRHEDLKGLSIYSDPLLEKVFFNLALNIIIHGKERVTDLYLSYQKSGDAVLIIFEDNGAGIPYEQKELIFSRRDESKKGMGLYFVREVLGITGITINETGTYGKGARFEIRVPKGKFRFETEE